MGRKPLASLAKVDAEERKRSKGGRTKEQIRKTRDGVLRVLYLDYEWEVVDLSIATGLSTMTIYKILGNILRPNDKQWNKWPYPEKEET